MTVSITDIAAIAASIASPIRVKDSATRALAMRTKDARKAIALEDARKRAEAYFDYTPSQELRILALRDIHWPRTRAVSNALSITRDLIRAHFDKYDDTVNLSQCDLYDAIRREWRLSVLLARTYAASAAIGRFPVSRYDMRTDKRTRFIGSAAARHFTFAGGRDSGSAEFDPADIVQGAFIRAIENGDTVDGVPTFGSMFRWIQTERAHLTRVSNAEYAARRNAALGHTTKAVEEWPDATDKHSMRLLGTRNYATLEKHRESLAIAHRDAELELLDDTVTHSARIDALGDVREHEETHIIVARVIMNGATLAEIADALGYTVGTLKAKVIESASQSYRNIDTNIDHSERSIDLHYAAEREREIDAAEQRHAERLIAREASRVSDWYANGRVFGCDSSPVDSADAGERVIDSMTRDADRVESNTYAPERVERHYWNGSEWNYAPDVIRAHALYMVPAIDAEDVNA